MIIDADAHVEESEAMFDRLDKEFRPRRPLPVRLATDTVYGKYNAVWLIDGETYPKLVGKGGTIFRTPTIMEAASLKRESIGAQELTDVMRDGFEKSDSLRRAGADPRCRGINQRDQARRKDRRRRGDAAGHGVGQAARR